MIVSETEALPNGSLSPQDAGGLSGRQLIDNGNTESTVEVRIPADSRYVAVARQAVDAVCGELEMSVSDRAAVRLAVGEACNNAVLHAQPAAQSSKVVTVACRMEDDTLEIDVTNHGTVLLPAIVGKMPEPLSESGRGIALIEAMMDSVQYLSHHGNTTVRMRKSLVHP